MASPKNLQAVTCILLSLLAFAALCAASQSPNNVMLYKRLDKRLVWGRQPSSSGSDTVSSMTLDGMNIILAGQTKSRPLNGVKSEYGFWIAKYTLQGEVIWRKQLRVGSETDALNHIAADANHCLYIVGSATGSIYTDGNQKTGAFLAKLTPKGNLLWADHLGSAEGDIAQGIAIDKSDGCICVDGSTQGTLFNKSSGATDIFVSKYDVEGHLIWGKQIGNGFFSAANQICSDRLGNLYIVGEAEHLFGNGCGGSDAFVAKLDSAGRMLWGRQFGTPSRDYATSVASDAADNVYVVGTQQVGTRSGNGFVVKYSGGGQNLWSQRWLLPNDNAASDVAMGTKGDIIVVGGATGSLFGKMHGIGDVVVAKYSSRGVLKWGSQFGVNGGQAASAVAVDGSGRIFISGQTSGNLFSQASVKRIGFDYFLAELRP